MTINNPKAYMAGIWDWKILKGCFGMTNIEPTDIDGCIERNGHFLYLETKSPGARVSVGQQRTHEAWVAKGDSVIIVWGETNAPQRLQVFSPKYPHGKIYENADLNKLRELVTAWFDLVDQR